MYLQYLVKNNKVEKFVPISATVYFNFYFNNLISKFAKNNIEV